MLAACASAPGKLLYVTQAAPKVSDFRFDGSEPLTDAQDFAPWAALTASNAAEGGPLEACLADREACATVALVRYRRLMEIAETLPPLEQLTLVHSYFNTVDWTRQRGVGTENWESLYRVASTQKGDCKAIAFGKYFTLRRLGWRAEDLRVVMGWDNQEKDWHALLAVHAGGETYMLDSIMGLQRPKAFYFTYMVYSISENGIWDHAPDYAPVP